jgi:hypothetical protein
MAVTSRLGRYGNPGVADMEVEGEGVCADWAAEMILKTSKTITALIVETFL